MANKVKAVYPSFYDLDGLPLENGNIYIGEEFKEPFSNQVDVFADIDLTIPLPQPINTVNGYTVANGTPTNIFTDGEYSITVRDKNDRTVFTELSSSDVSSAASIPADFLKFKAKALENISKGDPISITSYSVSENLIEIEKFSVTNTQIIGFAGEDIGNGSTGIIVTNGIIDEVDTSAYNTKDVLFATQSGTLVTTRPTSGNYQFIATIIIGNTDGAILVEISDIKQETELKTVDGQDITGSGDIPVINPTIAAQVKTGELTLGQTLTIDSWSYSGATITINTSIPHSLESGNIGESILISGLTAATNAPNGEWIILTIEDTDTITFTAIDTPTGAAGVSSATLKHGKLTQEYAVTRAWQNKISERVDNVTYTNNENYDIEIQVSAQSTSNSSYLHIDGNIVNRGGSNNNIVYMPFSATIPPGSTYKVDAHSGILYWYERRA